jgi:hypothetical protein
VRPGFAPRLAELVPGDLVTWEADYDDGTVLREAAGAHSSQIDRDRLVRFRLVGPGETLLDMAPPPGATGHNLIYRRRIAARYQTSGAVGISQKRRRVIFLVGWAPMGPVVMVDPAAATVREERAFIVGDPDMYPPERAPEDGRYLLGPR